MNASGNIAPRFRAAAIYGGAIRRGLGAPKRSGCGAIGDCQKHCACVAAEYFKAIYRPALRGLNIRPSKEGEMGGAETKWLRSNRRLPEALHPLQPETALFQKQTSLFQNQKYLQGGGAILGLSACFIETKEYLCNHILLDNPPVGGKSLNYKGVSAHTETPFFVLHPPQPEAAFFKNRHRFLSKTEKPWFIQRQWESYLVTPKRHGCGATRQARGAVEAPNGSQGVAGGASAKGVFYPITIGMALWRD